MTLGVRKEVSVNHDDELKSLYDKDLMGGEGNDDEVGVQNWERKRTVNRSGG